MTSASPSRQSVAGARRRAATVERLVDAALEEFAYRGYAGSTVEAISRRAGVTVQTLYDSVGSKRALLQLVMRHLLSDDPDYPEGLVASVAGLDPAETVRRLAHAARTIAERAQLGWRLYRDAAAVDDTVAEDWSRLQALRRQTIGRLLAGIPASAFRPDFGRDRVIDLAWTMSSPDSWHFLVTEAGRSPGEFEDWLVAGLLGVLAAADRR